VRFVELRLDDDDPMPGADGGLSPRQLARSLGVRVAPTIAFTDGRGALADPLVGYQGREFYAAYLAERIEEARAARKAGG
jgi:thioredoxin-related protein